MDEFHAFDWAISIRQPWCWAIVHAGKRLENRDWRKPNPGLNFRGPVCLHASSGMTRQEYNEAKDFMASIEVVCPPADQLQRGGIIGTAIVTDIVKEVDDPWFFGPRALKLDCVEAIPFVRCKGALGFFHWKESARELFGQAPFNPSPWMKPPVIKLTNPTNESNWAADLFNNRRTTP